MQVFMNRATSKRSRDSPLGTDEGSCRGLLMLCSLHTSDVDASLRHEPSCQLRCGQRAHWAGCSLGDAGHQSERTLAPSPDKRTHRRTHMVINTHVV